MLKSIATSAALLTLVSLAGCGNAPPPPQGAGTVDTKNLPDTKVGQETSGNDAEAEMKARLAGKPIPKKDDPSVPVGPTIDIEIPMGPPGLTDPTKPPVTDPTKKPVIDPALVPDLSKINTASVEQLVKDLSDSAKRELAVAGLLLKAKAGENVVEPLLGALKSADENVRMAAAGAVGVIGKGASASLDKLKEIAAAEKNEKVKETLQFAIDAVEGK